MVFFSFHLSLFSCLFFHILFLFTYFSYCFTYCFCLYIFLFVFIVYVLFCLYIFLIVFIVYVLFLITYISYCFYCLHLVFIVLFSTNICVHCTAFLYSQRKFFEILKMTRELHKNLRQAVGWTSLS